MTEKLLNYGVNYHIDDIETKNNKNYILDCQHFLGQIKCGQFYIALA